ncbi:unnamed protein product [Paramecium sonneborni]|uniref:Uncharacterized protein n=1 Tax=Paramecium sonneborni TaxID=65129 RepID=A0A8S1NIM7_9CILI|nr:unnamed protein product [Paramecium sonneborni]
MSQKSQINELKSYNHSYYRENNNQLERTNQKRNKNGKYKNNKRLDNNIKPVQSCCQDNDQFNSNNKNGNFQDSQENISFNQIQQNDQKDVIFCLDKQTPDQGIEKDNYQDQQFNQDVVKLNKQINDSQTSTDSFENKIGRRKSQIDWLNQTQIKKQNILKIHHETMQNIFAPCQLIHFDDDQILNEIEDIQKQKFSNIRIIECKYGTQKNIKKLKLIALEVLLQCSQCQKIIQVESNLIKQTHSPAIFIKHCDKTIRIDFLQNNNHNVNIVDKQRVEIAYLVGSQQEIVLTRAECVVICNCDNENDFTLTLEDPMQLNDGNYILLTNEPYRKLCRYCCREVIMQHCEFMIMS